jgi:hypothetical protein
VVGSWAQFWGQDGGPVRAVEAGYLFWRGKMLVK